MFLDDGARDRRVEGLARAPLTCSGSPLVLLIAWQHRNLLLARSAARAGGWPCGSRLAPDAQLSRQLLGGRSCAVFGGIGGLLVAQWTLSLAASVMRAKRRQPTGDARSSVLLFAATRRWAPVLFGLFPARHDASRISCPRSRPRRANRPERGPRRGSAARS